MARALLSLRKIVLDGILSVLEDFQATDVLHNVVLRVNRSADIKALADLLTFIGETRFGRSLHVHLSSNCRNSFERCPVRLFSNMPPSTTRRGDIENGRQ